MAYGSGGSLAAARHVSRTASYSSQQAEPNAWTACWPARHGTQTGATKGFKDALTTCNPVSLVKEASALQLVLVEGSSLTVLPLSASAAG